MVIIFPILDGKWPYHFYPTVFLFLRVIGVIRLANEVADDLHFIAFRTDHAAFAGDQQQALSGRRPLVDSAKQPAPPHQIVRRVVCQFGFHVLLDHHALTLLAVEKLRHLA
ncbi:hypothetical protein D3C86_1783100 [compost metagenome]